MLFDRVWNDCGKRLAAVSCLMTIVLACFGVALAFLALAGVFEVYRRIEDLRDRYETPVPIAYDDQAVRRAIDVLTENHETLDDALRALAEDIRDQTLAIAEGIERTDRAERRVKAVVTRAKRKLADDGFLDEALDAEAASLRRDDEASGGANGVPPMQQNVGGNPAPDMSAFPGDWS